VREPGHPLAQRSHPLRFWAGGSFGSASASAPRPHMVPVILRDVLGLRPREGTGPFDGHGAGEAGREGPSLAQRRTGSAPAPGVTAADRAGCEIACR